MLISHVGFNTIPYNKNKSAKPSQIYFKQVKPEHFFINIKGYAKDLEWGDAVSKIANESKWNVFNSVKKEVESIGEKYSKFYSEFTELPYGKLVDKGSRRGTTEIWKEWKYAPYYDKCVEKIETAKELDELTLAGSNSKYLSCQCQDKIDDKKITLTQIFKLASAKPKHASYSIYFIHPPLETSEALTNKAQTFLDELIPLKGKKLNKEEINTAYQKIGAIHWCLAQGMPFERGSAAIADIYTKSLFESLNIQTTPWKKGIAPDWEAFLTPMDEYSEKYKSFFSKRFFIF